MNTKTISIYIFLLNILFISIVNAAPSISIGIAQGKSSETVLVPITYNTDVSLQTVTLSVELSFVVTDILLGAPVASNNVDPESVYATYTGDGNLKIIIAPLPDLAAFSSGVLLNLPVTLLRAEATSISSSISGTYTLVDDTPTVTGSGALSTNITINAKVTDPLQDSDGDDINDLDEIALGLNPYDVNDASLDSDGDGLSNLTEISQNTNIFVADTDGDGLDDGFEYDNGLSPTVAASETLLNSDTDGDTLTLLQEYAYNTSPDLKDTDGDTIHDNVEIQNGLNPLVPNSVFADADWDELSDIAELTTHNTDPSNNDTDFDGMDDYYEVTYAVLDPNNLLDAGYDSEAPTPDGLYNLLEYNLGTNPMSVDSDGDCMKDKFEYDNNFNPASSADGNADKDSDRLNNKTECEQGSDIFVADTDGDGMKDGFEYTYSFPFTDPATHGANNGTTCSDTNSLKNGTGPGNDADCDTLTNLVEHGWGSNPKSTDSDNDNVKDQDEVATGRHPAVNEPAIMAIINGLLL